MTPEERKAFADCADLAIVHPLVEQVIEEYRQNMRAQGVSLERGTVARWGLFKCLNAAVQVARAQALAIDPQELVMSEEEAGAYMARMARLAADAGKPVTVMTPDDPKGGASGR